MIIYVKKYYLKGDFILFMKKLFIKWVAGLCIAVTLCSISTVDAHALTRRLYGDVNGDGVISQADAILIQRYIIELETLDNYQLIAADVSGDGVVSLEDAIRILRLLEGSETEFPAGECFYY